MLLWSGNTVAFCLFLRVGLAYLCGCHSVHHNITPCMLATDRQHIGSPHTHNSPAMPCLLCWHAEPSGKLALYVDGIKRALKDVSSVVSSFNSFQHGDNMAFSIFRRAGTSNNPAQFADPSDTLTGEALTWSPHVASTVHVYMYIVQCTVQCTMYHTCTMHITCLLAME